MNDPTAERIDAHLRETEQSTIDAQIATAVARHAGLELVRIARVRGNSSAVFEVGEKGSYIKIFSTAWYSDESELLRAVLDTLEYIQIDVEIVNMNIFSSDMFEYLCAEMLPLDGRTVSLTISGVTQETIAGPRGEDKKVIVSFKERPKKFILNKTNARALARSLGNETNDWRGATVALGVENVKVGRNVVPSIRVKSATPARGGVSRAVADNHAEPPPSPQVDLFGDDAPVGNGAYEE